MTRSFSGLEHFNEIIMFLFSFFCFHKSTIESEFYPFPCSTAINCRISKLHPAIDGVFNGSGKNFTVGHVVDASRIIERASFDRECQVNIGSTQCNYVLVRKKVNCFLLTRGSTFPESNRVISICVDCSKDKVFVVLETHTSILCVAVSGIERSDPLEFTLAAASHLRFGNGTGRLAAALRFDWVDAGCGASICRRMNTDAALELVIGNFVKGRHKIKLVIIGIGQIHIILNERHHAWETYHWVWNAAFFQNLNV